MISSLGNVSISQCGLCNYNGSANTGNSVASSDVANVEGSEQGWVDSCELSSSATEGAELYGASEEGVTCAGDDVGTDYDTLFYGGDESDAIGDSSNDAADSTPEADIAPQGDAGEVCEGGAGSLQSVISAFKYMESIDPLRQMGER